MVRQSERWPIVTGPGRRRENPPVRIAPPPAAALACDPAGPQTPGAIRGNTGPDGALMEDRLKPDWTARFGGLARLPDDIRAALVRDGRMVKARKGELIFGTGAVPKNLLFLLDGTLRVSQTSDTGREIVLYRVEAGQSCVMTTACVLAHEAYLAEGHAETDLTAMALPMATFDRLFAEQPVFRDFILAAYTRRITDLFRIIDEVAFGRIDVRLASRLLLLAGGRGEISTTHQALASELGTAREVVSRQLTEFQKRGWLTQSRGSVRIEDAAALKTLADS